MKKVVFLNESYYHIYNRGVEKRGIFQNPSDYKRFLTGLSEFNSANPIHLAYLSHNNEVRPRKKLVELACYCLMPNHFHIIAKQISDGGISLFMQKLGTGYTMYFNKKWNRYGVLFSGAFKAKPIENDEYLIHLSRYIHLNPIKFIEPSWKKEGIKDPAKARQFLRDYRWSSYHSYIKKSDSDIVSPEIIKNILNGIDYEKFTLTWTGENTALNYNEVRPR